MNNREIERVSVEIQKIHDHMLHALKLHVTVALDRSKIIRDMDYLNFNSGDNNKFKEDMVKLGRCHNDERMLMRITEPAISRTYNVLSDLTKGKIDKLDSEEKEILGSMFKALEFMEEKIHLTKTRIEKEEEYMKSPSEGTFGKYYNAWKDEIDVEGKLINIVNPAYLEPLARFRTGKYADAAARGASYGAVLGGLSGMILNEKNSINGAIVMAVIMGTFGAIAAMIIEYKNATKSIIDEQQNTLLKFQHR